VVVTGVATDVAGAVVVAFVVAFVVAAVVVVAFVVSAGVVVASVAFVVSSAGPSFEVPQLGQKFDAIPDEPHTTQSQRFGFTVASVVVASAAAVVVASAGGFSISSPHPANAEVTNTSDMRSAMSDVLFFFFILKTLLFYSNF